MYKKLKYCTAEDLSFGKLFRTCKAAIFFRKFGHGDFRKHVDPYMSMPVLSVTE